MSIKIVTDSTCDLPQAMVAKHGITVIPAYINMDGQSYLDEIELSRPEFYKRLPDCKSSPTTSAPGPGTFTRAYHKLIAEGATEILSIHISATLSNIVNVAHIAAEEMKAVPVTVLDSGQLTSGTGLLALTAAKAAAAGRPMSEIVDLVKGQAMRTHSGHAGVPAPQRARHVAPLGPGNSAERETNSDDARRRDLAGGGTHAQASLRTADPDDGRSRSSETGRAGAHALAGQSRGTETTGPTPPPSGPGRVLRRRDAPHRCPHRTGGGVFCVRTGTGRGGVERFFHPLVPP
jgi:hypothetical protein